MKKINVVAAIIIYNDEILCMQRGKEKFDYLSYKFEFPGGKIELGESKVEALVRELKEEINMNIDIDEDDYFMTVNHSYWDFEITMHSYVCRVASKEFEIIEHHDHKWLKREELLSLDWAAADIPIVNKIIESGL